MYHILRLHHCLQGRSLVYVSYSAVTSLFTRSTSSICITFYGYITVYKVDVQYMYHILRLHHCLQGRRPVYVSHSAVTSLFTRSTSSICIIFCGYITVYKVDLQYIVSYSAVTSLFTRSTSSILYHILRLHHCLQGRHPVYVSYSAVTSLFTRSTSSICIIFCGYITVTRSTSSICIIFCGYITVYKVDIQYMYHILRLRHCLQGRRPAYVSYSAVTSLFTRSRSHMSYSVPIVLRWLYLH
jgi:hypothetical protein